ncbi:hypothetical protein FLG15_08940 [Xanthomonas phaseoli pv. dieffenbachiae]|uniref:macro domain-containing protein n=1 Tax=Xanthomonas phaseoli TaxID=1985254 RepID=UPI0030E12EB8
MKISVCNMSELLQDMKTRRFWGKLLTKTFALLGTVTAVVKGVVTFWPEHVDWFGGGTIFVVALMLCALIGLGLTWPRPIECDYASPKTKIKIVKGDIFDQPGHLVIGATTSFDTQTPHVIKKSSLIGQAIDKLYGGDLARLNSDLTAALVNKVVVGEIDKPGNTALYETGTVATVPNGPRKLFFSAYAEMNETNNAATKVEMLTKSLVKLWEACVIEGNCDPVAITPWGGGPTRASGWLPAQDSIRLIILTFMFASRQRAVSDELTVVVPEDSFKKLDRLELQAFLSSLRSS